MGHALMYPGQKVSSPVCSFVSPAGWGLDWNENYDPDEGGRFAFMSRWLFEKADRFSEKDRIAYIAFFFGKNDNEESFLRTLNGRFVQEVGALRTVRKIDNKRIVFYRYQGPKFMELVVQPGQYTIAQDSKYESISIGFCSDFGFSGIFWGLAGHEEDFWDVIKSVQWKL